MVGACPRGVTTSTRTHTGERTMSTMTRPATIRLLAAVASLLLVSALIVRTTDAAFTAETYNTGNDFSAATVALADNDVNAPLFKVGALSGTISMESGDLVPGDVVENCIVITYSGDVPATDVELTYENGAAGALLSSLNLGVQMFASPDCSGTGTALVTTGTLADLAGTTWLTGWVPDPADATTMSRSFLFGVELDVAADNGLQAATASGVDFTWSTSSS
jgi:hypothetical protein